eukprot:11219729-Lingulodinium_polyedra.AAC.1
MRHLLGAGVVICAKTSLMCASGGRFVRRGGEAGMACWSSRGACPTWESTPTCVRHKTRSGCLR